MTDLPTVPHNPDDPAEVAAIQTPEGEPDAELLDPKGVAFTDESSERVRLIPQMKVPEDERIIRRGPVA